MRSLFGRKKGPRDGEKVGAGLFLDSLVSFFTKPPALSSAFQVSSGFFSGIDLAPKDRNIKSHCFIPLGEDVVEPSFYKPNIKKLDILAQKIKEGIEKLGISKKQPVSLLLPELSQKAFVFEFDSFPSLPQEREQFILFRVRKQLPMLPEDIRLSYDLIPSVGKTKVLVSVARASIIEEYEDIFEKHQIRIGAVGIPFLSLSRVLDRGGEEDYMLVNIERDSVSFVGVVGREISLYRQKTFSGLLRNSGLEESQVGQIAQEIENTARFIEDREKGRISSLWVRTGIPDVDEDWLMQLAEKTPLPVKGIDVSFKARLHRKEKHLLSPLIGELS